MTDDERDIVEALAGASLGKVGAAAGFVADLAAHPDRTLNGAQIDYLYSLRWRHRKQFEGHVPPVPGLEMGRLAAERWAAGRPARKKRTPPSDRLL